MKISKCVSTILLAAFAISASTPAATAAEEAVRLATAEVRQVVNSAEILPAAIAEAKAQNKKVMVLFSGLEWCMPCRVFDKNVMKKPVFANFARRELVLVEFDMKRNGTVGLETTSKAAKALKTSDAEKKRQARLLMENFGVRGVPCAVILDGNGREIFRNVGCGIGAEDFVKAVRDAK